MVDKDSSIHVFADQVRMRVVPMTCGNLNADELAEVIRRLSHDDPSLISLTMSWSNLGDSGCEKLSDSIRFNNYLVDLDIYSNNITSAGLVRMGTALTCVLFPNFFLFELRRSFANFFPQRELFYSLNLEVYVIF